MSPEQSVLCSVSSHFAERDIVRPGATPRLSDIPSPESPPTLLRSYGGQAEPRVPSGRDSGRSAAVIPSRPVSASMTTAPAVEKRDSIKLVAIASFIGTTIEWYDFFLYNTAAALIFPRLFFPTLDPLTGTLASFGTYTVGFVARPIGGIVMGHFGDRIGRKSMLVLTLILMGVATFGIGLLPT